MTEVNSTTSEQPAVETATTERPTLTLQDLSLMVQVLETGSARGAWKANELSSVGHLYDRVTSFLEAAGVPKNQPDDTPAE
jgi:hypothetical protein